MKKSLNVSMWVRELKAEEGRKFVETQKRDLIYSFSLSRQQLSSYCVQDPLLSPVEDWRSSRINERQITNN